MSRPSPLEAMIDAACACVKCGQKGKAGSCGCWVMLECPKCRKRRFVERNEFDPPNTARVQIQCPDCNAGDFDQPHYFDAAGRELSWEDAPAVRDSDGSPKGRDGEGGSTRSATARAEGIAQTQSDPPSPVPAD